MIIHHMSDGSIRNNIEGLIIPKSFVTVYEITNRKVNTYDNINKTKTIEKK